MKLEKGKFMLGHRLLKLIFILTACWMPGPLTAEEEDALYGAALPADAVFIRHFGEADYPIQTLGHRFAEGDFEAGSYTAISAGALYGAEAGAFYTLISGGGETRLVQEPPRDDRSRVHLFLLNAGEGDARLVVSDGGPEVIAPTPTGQVDSRAVNPLAVSLSVESAGQTHDFDVVLRRGVNVTFLVANGDVQVIEHQFGPVIGVD